VRAFTEEHIMPFCHEWCVRRRAARAHGGTGASLTAARRDEAKTLPKSLFEKASAAGWLPVCVGAWPTVRSARAARLRSPAQRVARRKSAAPRRACAPWACLASQLRARRNPAACGAAGARR